VSCGLHDVLGFEALGRPAVLIASEVFRVPAATEATNLGQPDARRVFVPHPVQDRTDAELVAMAAAALNAVIDAVTA
jgi:hypothetical protein